MPLAYGIVESLDLSLPGFPQPLDGFRVAHVSDLHTDRRNKRLDRMIYQLTKMRLDLGVLTGDYMTRHRGLGRALPYLRELVTQVRPAQGWYGVFGNHDWPELMDQAADLPVTWLRDQAVSLDHKPIDIVGLHMDASGGRPDAVSAALSVGTALKQDAPPASALGAYKGRRFRLALTHKPDQLAACSDLGADLVLAGHTHGGQVRLPFGLAVHNSSDLPLSMSAGLLRHRDTLCVVTRGVGSTPLLRTPINFRFLCPPQVPVYTLRRGSLQGERTDDIAKIWGW